MVPSIPPPLVDAELLGRFEELLYEQHAPLANLLQPGLTHEEIDERTAPLGLNLPHEARVWWEWHDGALTKHGELARTFGPGAVVSLDEAVHRWHEQRRISAAAAIEGDAEEGDPEYAWRRAWFPIVVGNGVAACDCSVAAGAPTPIRMVDYHVDLFDFLEPRTRSLGELVSWWIDALECGAYRYEASSAEWCVDRTRIGPERLSTGLL